MISSDNIKLHKDWKIVKKIEIDRELILELEEILEKQLLDQKIDEESSYQIERKSVFLRNKKY